MLLASALDCCTRLSPGTPPQLAIMSHVRSSFYDRKRRGQSSRKGTRLEVLTLEIQQAQECRLVLITLKNRVDALYVTNSAVLVVNRLRFTAAALAARLPTMFGSRGWLDVGGMMSYGSNFAEPLRRSADIVDKILRGTEPADIPVEQPTKFDLREPYHRESDRPRHSAGAARPRRRAGRVVERQPYLVAPLLHLLTAALWHS